jgi:uncharacterized protein
MIKMRDYAHGILPDVEDKATAPFWDGLRQGKILWPKCKNCGKFHWYPLPVCPFCHSADINWQPITSQARVYSWTCVRWNLSPEYAKHMYEQTGPYIVALVEFDEAPNFRLPTNLIECEPEDVKIGMPLDPVFYRIDDQITLLLFKLKKG